MPMQQRIVAVLGLAFMVTGAQAQSPSDAAKVRRNVSNFFIVYDFPYPALKGEELKSLVLQSVPGKANVQDLPRPGEAPEMPGKLKFKSIQVMFATARFPTCEDANFITTLDDDSLSKWGDQASYTACGFQYRGGYRLNIYADVRQEASTGAMALGKMLGAAMAGAMGFKSSPMEIALGSLDKLEALAADRGVKPNVLELAPALEGKTVVPDPLLEQRKTAERKAGDRARRLAARAELSKLGLDAADRVRFIKAIQQSDEDVVALFIEAGAQDLAQADEAGKLPADYATKPHIKALLVGG